MNVNEFYPIFLRSANVVIDSRKIGRGDLFFAFSGENYNAAERAAQAIEDGAVAVIVEDEHFSDPQQHIFYVPSTLDFLQELAIFHREKLAIPVIGLTGSNGKTTTKELISTVLASEKNVQYTRGNLNNHIGVPLTILSVRDEHQIAVVEMGANHQKEIAFLCTIARPTIGYITNFGKAHLEGFGGYEGVIKGKSELYDYLKLYHQKILVNQNDDIQKQKTGDYHNVITFGSAGSDYHYQPVYKEHFVGVDYQGTSIFSNLTGNYNYDNICAAVTLGLYFGIDINTIKEAIENYFPSNMRSQIQKKGNITLVLDTYNANPSSMKASLENFKTFEGSKLIIIGDMLELGSESQKEHQQILDMAEASGFDEIITVGPNFKAINFSDLAFQDTAQLIDYIKAHPVQQRNVLLKASRGIALEKVIDYL